VKKIFFCLLLLNFQNLSAQALEWYQGCLVLANNEVLLGEIAIKPEHDLVIFQHGESRMVYPAHRIKSMYFHDASSDINRRYISLVTLRANGPPVYHLFEIVIKGEVTVVRRHKESLFSIHADALDFNYHILYKDELTPLRNFNKKIFPQLVSLSDKRLEEFILTNRLTAHHAVNTIRIIDFYNGLITTDESLARN